MTGDVVVRGPSGEPDPARLDASILVEAAGGASNGISLGLGESEQPNGRIGWSGTFDSSGHFELQLSAYRRVATSPGTFTVTVPGSIEGSLSQTIVLPTVGAAPLPTFKFTAGANVAFPVTSQGVPIPGVHVDIADGPSGVTSSDTTLTFPLKVGEYQVTASIPGTSLTLTRAVDVLPNGFASIPFEFGILPPGALPGMLVPFGGTARQFLFQGDQAFTLSDDGVFQFSLPDRTSLQLSSSPAFGQTLALDESYVYWSGGKGGRVNRAPIGGGPTTPLASWAGQPEFLLVDSTSVYCAEVSGVITKLDKTGGLPVTIARGGATPESFVQDADNLYWTAKSSLGDYLLTVPKSGGEAVTLASATLPPLAIDSGRLFWSNSSGVFVRQLSTTAASAIPGTEDAFAFQVHDGQFDWVKTDGTLLSWPLSGGTTVTLGQLPARSSFVFHEGTWFVTVKDRGSLMFTPALEP